MHKLQKPCWQNCVKIYQQDSYAKNNSIEMNKPLSLRKCTNRQREMKIAIFSAPFSAGSIARAAKKNKVRVCCFPFCFPHFPAGSHPFVSVLPLIKQRHLFSCQREEESLLNKIGGMFGAVHILQYLQISFETKLIRSWAQPQSAQMECGEK